MRYRTAVKTGRAALLQALALSFSDYVAMVERVSAGCFPPSQRRFSPSKHSR